MKTYLALIVATIFLTSAYCGFLTSNADPIIGGLEDTLRFFKRADLESIALACNQYDLKKRGREDIIGGLHDYIRYLSVGDLISMIIDYTKTYPELNNLQKLKDLAGITDKPDPTNLDDKLNATPRITLFNLACACEQYDRNQQKKQMIGGLHDYAYTFSDVQLIKIIKDYVTKYPTFLGNIDNLFGLIQKKSLTDTELTDYLTKKNRDDLIHIALAVDSYDNEQSAYKRMGGLHDYVNSLNQTQIISAILGIVKRWPELRQEGKIDELLKTNQNTLVGSGAFGGIEDYLFRMNLDDLKSCALAAESYDRKQRKVTLLGGLHDYIDMLKNEQVYDIIVKYIDAYPALRQAGFLESLAKIPRGGFDMAFSNTSMDDLKTTCLALEAYDRATRKIILMGGLHDYIDTLKQADLINYIRNMAKTYPEISDQEDLDRIVKNYKASKN